MNQKGSVLRIVLIVIAVTIVGAAAYFTLIAKPAPLVPQQQSTSTPSEQKTSSSTTPTSTNSNPHSTSDWKTYSNSKYGLQIKYPPSWNIKECSSSDIRFSPYDQPDSSCTTPPLKPAPVVTRINSSDNVAAAIKNAKTNLSNVSQAENTIDGHKATAIVGTATIKSQPRDSATVILSFKGYIYELSYLGPADSNNYIAIFGNMVLGLKLTQ